MIKSKTTLAMLLTVTLFGISACTEANKDKTAEVQKETAAKLEQAKDKTSEVMEDLEDATNDAYDSAKEGAEDLMDATEEEVAELHEAAAKKLKEACIATKEETDGDPKDC
jgi:predicted transcriptional regulator